MITHTIRHLDGVFAGLSRQIDSPDTITLSCDSDDSALGACLRRWSDQLNASSLRWVYRPHCGRPRPAQARNNGVRALLMSHEIHDGDQLLFLDGDMILADQSVSKHRALATAGVEMVIAHRAGLDEASTSAFDADRYAARQFDLTVSAQDRSNLIRRQRKSERHVRWRAAPWQAAYKPRLLGAHHAVSSRAFLAVNGYDEWYERNGCEDDDLARRLNQLRPRVRVCVATTEIIGHHLWHGKSPPRPVEYRRRVKQRGLPIRCELGLNNPRSQADPCIEEISAGSQ